MLELGRHLATDFSVRTVGTLLVLVALETVLSADNAVALAALVQDVKDPKQQQQALNWGLIIAFVLRILLLFTATWVIQFWQVELGGALYLLWLSGKHFWNYFYPDTVVEEDISEPSKNTKWAFWQIIISIGFTDLAFSLDSVTAAVAVSSKTWLVVTGCILGIIALRFMAGLFVRWIVEFTYLLDAAYLTVLVVGSRLMLKALVPAHIPPKWIMLSLIIALFTWGFSQRVAPEINGDGTLQRYEQE
jgi:YkoY family integral membrane protein